MKKFICFVFLFCFFSFVLFAKERDFFTQEEKLLIKKLKSSVYLNKRREEERKKEAMTFFSFLLQLEKVEDRSSLKKINFSLFSKIEDENMILKRRTQFVEEMRFMELTE